MQNNYSPARRPDESLAEYRQRRQESSKVDRIVGTFWYSNHQGTYDPLGKVSTRHARTRRELHSQPAKKPTRSERRAAKRERAAPSWPRTPDQKAQGRPLIVIKPVRALIKAKFMDRFEAQGAGRKVPKWALDRLVR